MKPFWTAVSLITIILPATGRQTRPDCGVINVPAGAITNGENISLAAQETRKFPGGDPALMAMAQLDDDTSNVQSFYARVSNTPAVQENETLQIINEEVLFGEALACRGGNCHLVFIRPT